MTAQVNQHDPQGRRHGVWENYRLEGTISWRAHFLHGKAHGLYESYRGNGKPWWKRHYVRGEPHGLESYWENNKVLFKVYILKIK